MASIFIVDDDKQIPSLFEDVLSPLGHEVTAKSTAEEAIEYLKEDEADLIFLDLKLPGMDGISFLQKLNRLQYKIPVVVITGYANIDTAVQAMKLGAYDYVRKPLNLDEILIIVNKIVEELQKDEQLAYYQKQKDDFFGFGNIVGSSKPMQDVFRFIQQVAHSPKTTVLIRGETGTGKELVARAIHHLSDRSDKPFIEINCSAFQETLLEAELFGYEAGAFTGATKRKKGLLELANHGSFFLDEIGDMSSSLQAKILKVIEKQTFRRVGGTRETLVDVRIISASSRDIEKCITEGTFREDLYYRINVATITLPPLRDREDDVIILAEHFLKLYNAEFKKNIKGISPQLKDYLRGHSWPGNVRELKNLIERAVLFEDTDRLTCNNIAPIDNKVDLLGGAAKITIPTGGIVLDDIEKSLIEEALRVTKYNQTRAAKMLNISRETLKYRVKKYHITY
jgi:two-component system response regulator AtoC